MASYTTNLNLKKPAGSENVAIGDINNNMDIIDNAYGTVNSKLKENVSNKISLSCAVATISTFSAYKCGSIVSISFIATATGNIASGTEVVFNATYADNNLKTIQRSQIGGSNQAWTKFLCADSGNFSAVASANFTATNAFWFTFQYVCNG